MDYFLNIKSTKKNKQQHRKVLLSSFHFRISSIDSKVRFALYRILTNNTTGKYRLFSTVVQLSFEWSHYRTFGSHFRISSIDLEVRIALYRLTNSTTGKYRLFSTVV